MSHDRKNYADYEHLAHLTTLPRKPDKGKARGETIDNGSLYNTKITNVEEIFSDRDFLGEMGAIVDLKEPENKAEHSSYASCAID